MAHNKAYKKTKNYFRFKLGFTDQSFLKVIADYSKFAGIVTTNKGDDVCVNIQNNWNEFMHWWGTVKHNFKDDYSQVKIKYRPRRLDYNEWWQQSNMDGSFAYNGVTDDF